MTHEAHPQEPYACRSPEHIISRRRFFGDIVAGSLATGGLAASGFTGFTHSAVASSLKKQAKQVLLVFQHGGLSQLESWDPKPHTDTGGPMRPIATSVPGIHVCELLPHTARLMHHMTLLRGLSTGDNNHDSARVTMLTGWKQGVVGGDNPSMGAICTKFLQGEQSPQPSYVVLCNRPQWHLSALHDASFLGSQYAPVVAYDEAPPDNLVSPVEREARIVSRRAALRRRFAQRFARDRRSARTDAYDTAFDKALQLMERQQLFDLSQIPERDHDRYGRHAFGQRCLVARTLLESGCTFVKLNHGNYDTHFENFNHHFERLGEFDRPFAALLQDIVDRGLLETTLVILIGEFGRTPTINASVGRDHWSDSWSMAMAGCGVKSGGAFGKTNHNGVEVTDGKINSFDLFHTFYRALGLDAHEEIFDGDRPVTLADPHGKAVEEVLA